MSDISFENLNRILNHNFDSEFDIWSGRSNDMYKVDEDSIYKQLNELKTKLDYKANNIDFEKQSSEAIKHMGDLRGKYDDIIMMKDEIARINNTSELHGNNWNNFKVSQAGQDLASVVGGKIPARLENDTLGYDIDGVFMSAYDIRKMINNTVLDKSSKDVLNGMIEYYKTQAYKEGAGEPDVNEIRSKLDSEIVSKGNMHSLENDKIIETPGGSFKQDFINNLLSLKHKDIGIDSKANENINIDEAIAMSMELDKDENLKKEQLIDYFTSHVVDQYEMERQQNPRANYVNNLQSKTEELAQATQYEKGSL